MIAADPTTARPGFRSLRHAQDLSEEATKAARGDFVTHRNASRSFPKMNGIIYLVGLVVVILAILSFFGLR
jgi:hypothetical protein